MATLKPHSNAPLYSNTVLGTLAVDGWAVTFGTARRGMGGLGPRPVPPRCTKCNSPSINIVHNVVGLWTTVLRGHRACWGACNVVSGSFAGATCMATILLNRIGFNVHRQNMKLIYRQQNARKHVDLQPSTVPFKVLARQISLSYEM